MDHAEQSARRYIAECIAVQGGDPPPAAAVERAVHEVAEVTRRWIRLNHPRLRRRRSATDAWDYPTATEMMTCGAYGCGAPIQPGEQYARNREDGTVRCLRYGR